MYTVGILTAYWLGMHIQVTEWNLTYIAHIPPYLSTHISNGSIFFGYGNIQKDGEN